jgi:hypothetical protein
MKIRVYLWNTMLAKFSPDAIFDTIEEARDHSEQKIKSSRIISYAKLMEYNPRTNDITGKEIEKFTIA